MVWDSAGIEIVENTSPAWAAGEGWRLSDEPLLIIGVAEGAEEYEFYDVISALRVNGGEIAVACRGSNEVRFFDSGGTHLHSVGREGGGPGEFRTMFYMWRLGSDSLAVFEYGNARVSVLKDDGQFGRTVSFHQVPGRPTPIPVGPFSDGSFLGRAHMLGDEEAVSEGVHRGTVLFVRWSGEGQLLDTEVPRPDGERYHGIVSGRSIMRSPPFGREFSVVTSSDSWYYGSMDQFEIEEYSPEGDLIRIIRREVENRRVTPELEGELRHWALEQYGGMPAPVLDFILSMPIPGTTPAHGTDIVTDDDGNLWIPEYRLPTEQPSWTVFDPKGRFLGVVDTPANGFLTDIGSDFILGVWQDELDVEQVRMYRIIKGE
ncbi:hypothetical protein ACFL3S_04280 [Gemmatimonadota bacterium]